MIPTTEQFWDEYNGDDVTTSFPITTAVKDFDPTLVTVARKISGRYEKKLLIKMITVLTRIIKALK